MKTWEMFKSLSENQDKEYERISDGMKVWLDDGLSYRWDSGHEFIAADDRWRQVIKPVPFMVAFDKFKNEGKDIYCNFNGNRYAYSPQVEAKQCFKEDYIQYGKWFILEE